MSPTQHKVPTDEEQEETARPEARTAGKKRRRGQWAFVRWKREDQLKAFFGWLPQELHDAPGIDWTELAPEIMGYLVKTVGHSPDVAVMAVAAASMHGAIDKVSQYTLIKNLGTLLKSLRDTTSIQCLVDLKQEQVWFDWAVLQEKKKHTLAAYVSIATGHFPRYLRRLTFTERQRMQRYTLPAPPSDLAKKCFPAKQIYEAQKKARKETTDVLVPLYPILRQMVRLRKQLAERTLLTIREACHKVETGEAILPYHFQHTDIIPEVSRDARTVAEVRVLGREVTMNLILWDKRTWVTEHPDLYGNDSVEHARNGTGSYTEQLNRFFVQFDGAFRDCLWFGDLVEQRVFKHFAKWEGAAD